MLSLNALRRVHLWPKVNKRVILLPPDYVIDDYSAFQSNFMDQKAGRLIPSTDLFIGQQLIFSTNSLGCKGEEPDGRPVVAFFGDSVTQGINIDSFCRRVSIPGYQSLNAGIEGSPIERSMEVCLELHAKRPLACAVIHPGWHNLIYGGNSEAFWEEQFDRLSDLPLVAHFTLVADMNDEVLERGYQPFFRGAPPAPSRSRKLFAKREKADPYFFDDQYSPWFLDYADKEQLLNFKQQLDRFNTFIRRYCAERNRPLIDLAPVLAPQTYDEVSTKFFDLIHPRMKSYALIGAEIGRQLAPYLPEPGVPKAAKAPARTAPAGRTDAQPVIGKNYPLW
jgi:hypothetical protein